MRIVLIALIAFASGHLGWLAKTYVVSKKEESKLDKKLSDILGI